MLASGFIMILQNLLAVFVLQLYADGTHTGKNNLFLKILGNPVIVAAIAGAVSFVLSIITNFVGTVGLALALGIVFFVIDVDYLISPFKST